MKPILLLLLTALPILAAEPRIVAHRGASHDAPENTLPAFELAWKQGADAIEGDFHLTADQRIVCVHDADTKRCGDRNLSVARSTLAQLREVDVGAWKGSEFKNTAPPTLAEVMATVPAGKKIYIEIKCGPEIVPFLGQELASSGLQPDQIVIISFNAEVIREVKRRSIPGTANWLSDLSSKDPHPPATRLSSLLATLKDCGADGLGAKAIDSIDEEFVRALKDAGFGFHVWTVDDPAIAGRFAELGVGSLTTNRPAFLRKALATP